MIKPIRAILNILQGRITLDSGTVWIIKRDYPYDHTPCITIDDSTGTNTVQKNIINKEYPIPKNHPQYDPNNPDKTISQQVIREERIIDLDINIWCDTEDEREEITKQISDLFDKVQSDHYTYCSNYNDGECLYLEDDCKVDDDTSRGVKKQCPHPEEYHYQNIFTLYDIIRPSFNVEPAYDMDDFTVKPVVLRSIVNVTFSYYDYHIIGGAVSSNLIVDEELL